MRRGTNDVKMKGKTMQGKQYFGLGESADSADMQEVFEGAIPMARELAERSHVMSQFSMGEAYLRGWGAPRDIREAARWYRKAAEQGQCGCAVRTWHNLSIR